MTNRDRDIRVAKALGWRHVERDVWIDTGGSLNLQSANGIDPETNRSAGVPHFTTDMTAAWTLVERVMPDGWELSLDCDIDCGKPWWVAEFRRLVDGGYTDDEIIGGSTSPSEAIVDAALQILEAGE